MLSLFWIKIKARMRKKHLAIISIFVCCIIIFLCFCEFSLLKYIGLSLICLCITALLVTYLYFSNVQTIKTGRGLCQYTSKKRIGYIRCFGEKKLSWQYTGYAFESSEQICFHSPCEECHFYNRLYKEKYYSHFKHKS